MKSFSWAKKGIRRRAALSVFCNKRKSNWNGPSNSGRNRGPREIIVLAARARCVRRRRITLLRSYFCDMAACRKCASYVENGWIALECEITRKARAKLPIPSLIESIPSKKRIVSSDCCRTNLIKVL